MILHPQQRVTFKDFSQIELIDCFANGNRMKMNEKLRHFYIEMNNETINYNN